MSVMADPGDAMQRAARACPWVHEIAEGDLIRRFGALTMARAGDYASAGSGRLLTVVTTEHGATVVATVRGADRRRYQTLLRRPEDARHPGAWRSRCSCPVGQDCKHGLAVVLALRAALGTVPGHRSWEAVLAPLLAPPPEPRPRQVPDRLAIGVTLTDPDPDPDRPWRALTTRVEIEPLREGRTRAFVRTGVTWPQLLGAGSEDGVAPQVQASAAELWGLHLQAPASRVSVDRPRLDLASLGAPAWSPLRRMLAAGVPLLQDGDPELPIALHDTHTVRMELVPGSEAPEDETGDVALRVVPRLPGGPDLQVHAGLAVVTLGHPPHALVLREGRRLHWLIPLDVDLHPVLAAMLATEAPLVVPADDVGTFVSGYHRPLTRHGEITSAVPGFDLPPVRPPSLLLTLRPGRELGEHTLTLDWGFGYGDGKHRARVPLTGPSPGFSRDVDAELTLLERWPSLPWLGTQRRAERRGDAVAAVRLTGVDAARFVLDTLPALPGRGSSADADGDVVVEVDGVLPDYHRVGEDADLQVQVEVDAPVARDGVDWFDLAVRVEVDGEQVPFRDLFAALTTGEASLLLASGAWFDLDRPSLSALREVIEESRTLDPGPEPSPAADDDAAGLQPAGEGHDLRLAAYDVDLWQRLLDDGVVARDTFGWSRAVRRLVADPPLEPVPAGVHAQLRPYQQAGYTWLAARWDAGLGAVLADDMGLGKTLQTLALVQRAADRGEVGDGAPPVLVVAPTSVVNAWAEQAAAFVPGLRTVVVEGTRARRVVGGGAGDLAQLTGGAHLVLTSYTLVRLEAAEYHELRWAGAVLDEAQAVKNPRSRTYDAVRRLDAGFRLVVTGTPLENSLMDLWAMLSLSVPGLFPRPERFGAVYRTPIESRGDTERLARLRSRIAPFVLRRTKEAVTPELPPKQEQVVHVPLGAAHHRLYQRHLTRERQRVLGLVEHLDQHRVAVLASLTRLRQLSLDPRLVDPAHEGPGGAKLEVLLDLVRELHAEGHRALVFSSFTRFLRLAQTRLESAGLSTVYLDGASPAGDRRALIDRFRTGTDPVFLVSLKAGGVGLTLTEADYVIVLDPWWNPAAEAQAVDRTHRIGQVNPVHVYRLVSTDTVEEKVLDLQAHKRRLAAAVLATGADPTGAPLGARAGLTAEDVRELLS